MAQKICIVMNASRKVILPIVIIFIMLNAIFITGKDFFEKNGIDSVVLIAANAVLFISNFITVILLQRSFTNANPNVFVRSMMLGTIIKLFVIAVTLVGYMLATKKEANKPAIYISIALYFLYLIIEVSIVLKLNKQKNG
jgi:hypothetical protein